MFEFDKNDNHNEIIKNTLHDVNNWLHLHNLQVNLSKTKLIQFFPSQKKTKLSINVSINSTKLEEVNNFKLLGITLDSNVNWKEHIQMTKSKLSSFTYALFNLRRQTDKQTALSAYHAFAHSRLSYGIALWGGSTDAYHLFVMQKKCLRIIAGIQSTTSCRPFFGEYGILTLPCQYIMALATYVRNNKFKFKENKNPRFKHQLLQPAAKIKMLQNSPEFTAVKVYNKLPNDIKSLDTYNLFHKELKSLLLRKCYYSLSEFMSDKYS